jgi:hypothetical protein
VSISQDFKDARKALNQAWHNFHWADPDYIDIAIADIAGAEMRVGQAIKEAREEVRAIAES